MCYHGLIAAGFGGQGVMLFGQILSLAAMIDGKYTTWLPSYGPEMRGGTANCTVIISDEYIASPVLDEPTEVVAFNIPSMLKFEKNLKEEGLLFINSSVIDRKPSRKDIHVIKIPASEIADEIGNPKILNMVMLGAYLKATEAVSHDSIKEALERKLIGKKKDLLKLNLKAIEAGMREVVK
ncbi:2-oxoacid:acceptor oxidoreductase family protein [Petrotoga sp. 9PWA.NaAc.5.4]|uniref:2-oxoacid:acceptor oxidoreductase family protein n=1 Tax=Petrotoga sp. 9PWA.NaAc.5.4 TaxID=1434328 RepID=UPI000CAEC358|nr:2-oxoacid:acceptor oxidoreductase family protein [Petrotoga sp. 9PWA.NaAc.5.4]PNR93657.1 2-oxoacid:ferredoxin oxidoreductase subunit gamma [Petrotoga sp. 9PWA.NaAc.5.4]